MFKVVEDAIVYLIRKDRFYAEFIQRMKKIITTEVETAGIAVDTGGIYLFINEFFLRDLTLPAAAEIMKHECEHLLRDHFLREKTLEPALLKEDQSLLDRFRNMSISYLLNIAEDYAINETLHNLPEKFRIFDKNGDPIKDEKTGKDAEAVPASVEQLMEMFPEEKIERHQAFEYYYRFIKKKAESGEFNGKYGNFIILPMDSHDKLNKSLKETDPELLKEIVKQAAKEAREAAGTAPGHIEIALDKLNQKTKNWRQELQLFAANCADSENEPTNKRRNRRYGLLYPGNRVKVNTTLAVVLDTSASVNDKQLAQFGSELVSIYANGVNIVVLECDTQVNRVYKYDPTIPFKVTGRGGTAFLPAFKEVASEEFNKEYGDIDGLIYLSDGDNYETELPEPNFPVLWALLPGCRVKYEWGHKTHLEVN